jgi:hypothetical protein
LRLLDSTWLSSIFLCWIDSLPLPYSIKESPSFNVC